MWQVLAPHPGFSAVRLQLIGAALCSLIIFCGVALLDLAVFGPAQQVSDISTPGRAKPPASTRASRSEASAKASCEDQPFVNPLVSADKSGTLSAWLQSVQSGTASAPVPARKKLVFEEPTAAAPASLLSSAVPVEAPLATSAPEPEEKERDDVNDIVPPLSSARQPSAASTPTAAAPKEEIGAVAAVCARVDAVTHGGAIDAAMIADVTSALATLGNAPRAAEVCIFLQFLCTCVVSLCFTWLSGCSL